MLVMILQKFQISVPAQTTVNRQGYMLSAPDALPVELSLPGQALSQAPVLGNIRAWVEF